MTHVGYIAAAYLAAFAVIGGLAFWVVLDRAHQRRRLQQLESEGARRRSGATEASAEL